MSAWLITRAWQMPPVLDLTVAVVAVRALGISRASSDTASGWPATTQRCGRRDRRERIYDRLAAALSIA